MDQETREAFERIEGRLLGLSLRLDGIRHDLNASSSIERTSMKAVIAAFYREPVVFLGVVQGVSVALATAHVIAVWVSLAVVAGCIPFQRHFVTPDPAK